MKIKTKLVTDITLTVNSKKVNKMENKLKEKGFILRESSVSMDDPDKRIISFYRAL